MKRFNVIVHYTVVKQNGETVESGDLSYSSVSNTTFDETIPDIVSDVTFALSKAHNFENNQRALYLEIIPIKESSNV